MEVGWRPERGEGTQPSGRWGASWPGGRLLRGLIPKLTPGRGHVAWVRGPTWGVHPGARPAGAKKAAISRTSAAGRVGVVGLSLVPVGVICRAAVGPDPLAFGAGGLPAHVGGEAVVEPDPDALAAGNSPHVGLVFVGVDRGEMAAVGLAELLRLEPRQARWRQLVLGVGLEDGVVMAGVHALLALVPHPAVIGVGVVADGGVPDAEEVAAFGVEAGLVA